MNSAEIWEGTDEWPEICRRSEEGAGKIEGSYLVCYWGENGDDSGGGSVGAVVEFDTLEVGEG